MNTELQTIIDVMPSNERARIDEARVLRLAGSLQDEVCGIAYVITMPAELASRSQVRSGTALVTSTRLILVDTDGGTTTLSYSDIQRLRISGGKKKMLGGYTRAQLWITRRDGSAEEWSMGARGDWGYQVATAAVEAHETYALSQG
jgi:hypothetical protein